MGIKQIVFTGSKSAPPSASMAGLMIFDYIMIGILLVLIAISIYYIVTTPSSVSSKEKFVNRKKQHVMKEKFSSKKKAIVYLHMNGCPYCTKFDATFEEAKKDKEISGSYEMTRLDNGPEGKAEWTSWNEIMKCNGFPCYAVVDSSKNIVKQNSGFKSVSDFKQWLSS